MDWQDLVMVLGGAVMNEEDLEGLLSVKITTFICRMCYKIDCI